VVVVPEFKPFENPTFSTESARSSHSTLPCQPFKLTHSVTRLPQKMTGTFQGSCLCGAVSYEIKSRPKALSHCHCNQCRKSHGAAFASYGSMQRTDLHIIQGAECITTYRSSESVLRQFCGHCGSSLFWSRSRGEYADWISIALGSLDTTFTTDKAHTLNGQPKPATMLPFRTS
jgi:hypothetical protein